MTQQSTVGDEQTVTDQVKEQVTRQAEVAQDKARQAAEQARWRLRDQLDQRSTEAGERLAGTAADVRQVAGELRRQGKDAPARLVEQAADQAERAASYLRQASGDRLLRDVEDLARSNPWAVAAGGLALGFAASRFLKASSSRRYQAAQAGWSGGAGGDDRERSAVPPSTAVMAEPLPPEGPLLGGYEQTAPTQTAVAPVDDRSSLDPGPQPPRAE
jgi:hypothetical protein